MSTSFSLPLSSSPVDNTLAHCGTGIGVRALTCLTLALALTNTFFISASVGCGQVQNMSHRSSLTREKLAIYNGVVNAPESSLPQRKAARRFSSAEAMLLFPGENSQASPIQLVMDEWVIPTLARAFLAGRTENTAKNKPTSHHLDKEL